VATILWVTLALAACVPYWGSEDVQVTNPCAWQTEPCNGELTKSVLYPEVTFPDEHSPGDALLFAKGETSYSQQCNAKVVGGPYGREECWPDFYSPLATDGGFKASAMAEVASPVWAVAPQRAGVRLVFWVGTSHHTNVVTLVR